MGQIFTHQDIKKNINDSFDVCVVGSGAGGAPLAKELAEFGLSVVLLEEGGYFETKDFQHTNTIDSLINLYRDGGGTFLTGKPNVLYVEGRCVGGSTTINGGMCWRTPEKILKRWRWERGLSDLTPEKMDFYFKRVEEIISVKPVLPESMNHDSLFLKKGADKLGYRVKENLRNHDVCVGTNQCLTGCPTGGKQPPLVTYIPAFLKAGGTLIANCRVKKINFRGDHAAGVSASIVDPRTKQTLQSVKIHSKITVVCGGAIQTPALLMRSGVPDKSRLLGQNLFVHPNTKLVGVFEDEIKAWQGVNQAYQITEYMNDGIIMAVNFVPPGIASMALPFYGIKFWETLKEVYNHCVFGAALIEDTSRGRVKCLPFDHVLPLYSLNQRDFELALRATALLAEIYFAAGAKRVYLPFSQLPVLYTVDEIRKIYQYNLKPIDMELLTVHIMGTCQMGADIESSVVDPFGQVHGVEGLFVADASVFPTSIGVNPQETIMALSTRTAFYIAENASKFLTK